MMVSTAYIVTVAAVFGLLIGSFLNVVAIRVPKRESISFPPSHCVHCAHRLGPLDLVPVISFLALRGHCRFCRNSISIQYPIVEAITATVFAYTAFRLGYHPELLVALVMASLLIVSTVTDLKLRVIPNRITYFGMIAVGFLRLWIHPLPVWMYGAAFLIGGGLFYLLAIISRGGMGGGDIKLFALVGLFLGPVLLGLAVFFSCLLGTVYGAGLIAVRKGTRKTAIAFGPFIALGTWLAYLFGEPLYRWYMMFYQK